MQRFPLLVALVLTVALPASAAGQELDLLPPGTKVRAVLTGPPVFTVHGTLLRNASDSIVIGGLRAGAQSTFAKDALQRLEVSNTQRSPEEGFARGAKFGALVGLGIGAALITYGALEDTRNRCNDCYVNQKTLMAVATVPITLVTAILGGAIGMGSRDEWVVVRLR